MAKRHHSGRMHTNEMYAGKDERRKQERMDAGMISEDHSAIANLPQGVVMKEYPKPMDYMDWTSDDTIRGVDGQRGADHAGMKKHFKPHKY